MAHTPSSSPRPTLLAASTTASYSSRSPSSASAAPALSPAPASTADMVATNGDRNGAVSSHAPPNLGGSINSGGGVKAGGGVAGAGDFLDVRPGTKHPAPGDLQRKCSTGSAAIMDLYGNSSQLGNRSMQRDIMASRASVCPSAHSAPPTRGDSAGGSPGADPRKSRKFLNHWKQAASLTKIGSREAE